MNENSVFEQLALWNAQDTLPKATMPSTKECGADKLKEAARRGDSEECNRVTFDLYGLNADERAARGGNGQKSYRSPVIHKHAWFPFHELNKQHGVL